jgi:solute:Na+ symporter, SSS family
MNISLALLGGTLLLALGLCVGKARNLSLEQWSVGGRGFGTMLVFLLMAGEIYTTFTFLGGSGWAYGKGAPAFYIIAYGSLAYIMSYWLLPAIWKRATEWRVVSQPEFFARAYGSRTLGTIVAVVSVIALIPYLVLQLKGLGIIVAETSYGAIGSTAAIWIGTSAVVVYVVLAGIHGSAMTAAIKDILVLVVVLGLGIALPVSLHGGIGNMFETIARERPDFLVLPAQGFSPSWFVSTVLLTACGFYMWPHTFGSIFSARDARVFRRNAALMPLYQLVLLFVFFVGFAALLSIPGLEGSDVDLSLLRITRETYGPVVLGVVGSAGLLTALVPGSMILMATATLIARTLRPAVDGSGGASVGFARMIVPVVAGVALYFTFRGGDTIVTLLLMGYALVTQLFPALLGALWPAARITAAGAMAGILTGVAVVGAVTISGATVASLFPSWPPSIADANIGALALLANVFVMFAVSRVTRDATFSPQPAGAA